jgi:hypothetical protein
MLVSGHAGKQRAARARAAVIPALRRPYTEALWMNRMRKRCGVAAAMRTVPAGSFRLMMRGQVGSRGKESFESKVKCAACACKSQEHGANYMFQFIDRRRWL